MNAISTPWPMLDASKTLKRLAAGTIVAEWSHWPWRSKVKSRRTEAEEPARLLALP